MLILAHNDPMWITFGMTVGIAIGIGIVLRLAAQNRK
jgi:hypothetical protein